MQCVTVLKVMNNTRHTQKIEYCAILKTHAKHDDYVG